jgi:NAD(P)H dehydrogenase (quinone)
MARVTIVVGHSLQNTYCEALGEAYRRGATNSGHNAELFVLSRLSYDPILKRGYEEEQPLEPDLQRLYEAMKSSDRLVIIFPLWCGDMPAILKGFIERLIQPDLVRIQKSGQMGMNLGIFPDLSARVIMTMGMPALFYRFYFGAHALKLLRRNILQFIGVRPVRSSLLGMVHVPKRRDDFLKEVEQLGRQAA